MVRACAGRRYVDVRDVAELRLLLDTGMRLSEFALLRPSDMHLDKARSPSWAGAPADRPPSRAREHARSEFLLVIWDVPTHRPSTLPNDMTTVPKRTLLRFHGATAEGESFLLRVALLVPLVVALVYLVILGFNIRGLLFAAYWNSDTAALPFVAELLSAHPISPPLNGISQPGYLQIDLWTSWLPMHRLVWKWAFGPGLMVVAMVMAGWAVARLSNRWAGLLAAALIGVASPEVLSGYLSQNYHSSTWMGQCLLFAYAVYVLAGRVDRDRRRTVAFGIATAVVVGFWSASDPMLAVDGILPAGIATGVVACAGGGLRTRRRNIIALGSVVLGSVVVLALTQGLLFDGQAWTRPPFVALPLKFADGPRILMNLGLLVNGVLAVGNGRFLGATLGPHGILLLGAALVSLCALAIPWVTFRRQRSVSQPTPNAGRLFAATYWLSIQVVLVLAFLVSEIPVALDSWRYLIPLLLAAACTVPIWAEGRVRARLLMAGGSTIVLLSAVANVQQYANQLPGDVRNAQLSTLTAFLQSQGLHRGYAPYWDAFAVSWQSGGGLVVLPVMDVECPNPEGVFCRVDRATSSSFYEPEQGPTFYVFDPGAGALASRRPPDEARYGRPIAEYVLEGMTVYVYSYDIASRFTPS